MTAPAQHPHAVELRGILADFKAKGIAPTPLRFISAALDRGIPETVAARAAQDLEKHLAERREREVAHG